MTACAYCHEYGLCRECSAGDHPPTFTPEQLAEIRQLAAEKWEQLHRVKNEASSQQVRDALTTRLLNLQTIRDAG